MKKVIDLSIIIVSYNTKELTLRCLQSIKSSFVDSAINYEVIVVDNNSLDESIDAIKNKFPQVKLLINSENVGFGRANNQGIQKAQGEVVFLLNSDTLVIERGVERLYHFLKKQPEKTIVGGKLFNFDKTPQDSAGKAYTLPTIFTALFLKGDHFHVTRYSPENIKDVDWVMGACIMTYKTTFENIGFFDEGIFMYMEEIDWEYRAKQKGYNILFFPEAHFFHLGSGSSKGREMPILNVFRGFLYFYKKHYSIWHQIILRFLLILKSLFAIVLFIILSKKNDRDLYIKALKMVIHT